MKLYISSFYIISLILSKIRIPIGTRLRIDILRNLRQFVLFAISKILQSEWTPISLRFLRRGKYCRTQREGHKSVKWQLVINRSFSRRINNRCGESNELPHLRFGGRGGWWASGRNGLMCKTAFNSISRQNGLALIRFMQNKSGHVKQVTWRKCAIRRQLARREGAYCNLSAAIRGICSHM